MMALAALSLALQNRVQSADALEHYQQVIPALKIAVQSSQDSYSDGALFTHFILLIYEVCLQALIRFQPHSWPQSFCHSTKSIRVTMLLVLVFSDSLTYQRLQQRDIEIITCGNTTGQYSYSRTTFVSRSMSLLLN
jgi:hypothetical protein